jgi:hypothetical protein
LSTTWNGTSTVPLPVVTFNFCDPGSVASGMPTIAIQRSS